MIDIYISKVFKRNYTVCAIFPPETWIFNAGVFAITL
jgi:hypothetical protein